MHKVKGKAVMVNEITKEYMLVKVISIIGVALLFFLSAFYYKVDAGLEEMAQMNTTLAVAVSKMEGLDIRVQGVEQDVKKLNDGFINLQTRVGYLERD